jgi:hypothetical protein
MYLCTALISLKSLILVSVLKMRFTRKSSVIFLHKSSMHSLSDDLFMWIEEDEERKAKIKRSSFIRLCRLICYESAQKKKQRIISKLLNNFLQISVFLCHHWSVVWLCLSKFMIRTLKSLRL